MDNNGLNTGKLIDAYEFLGCHLERNGAVFRVYAPAAVKVSVIGEFNEWQDTPMNKIGDGSFWAVYIADVKPGQMYKYKIYKEDGNCTDHCDPYGYGMELRPASASIVRNLNEYQFHDAAWLKARGDCKEKALNIYEIHAGSWKKPDNRWYHYDELAEKLIPYLKEYGYNYVELLPVTEHSYDASWGYQPTGFFAPTSRYGSVNDYKKMIDLLHQNGIGIIMDFVVAQFATDDYALADFDGTELYGRNGIFDYSKGAVRSFLQSCANYWLKEYHVDGLRMGLNKNVDSAFLQQMNSRLKELHSGVILAAENAVDFSNVTVSVQEGGLGFDYQWNTNWVHNTLEYFEKNSYDREKNSSAFASALGHLEEVSCILSLSHDEVVHGKKTVIEKMNGDYDRKFPQARAFYAFMTAYPGKKLTFMGNEIAHFREWDEKREQDWNLLDFPKHQEFSEYMKMLNKIYGEQEALWNDDPSLGFEQITCEADSPCVYAWKRISLTGKVFVAVFHFSDKVCSTVLPLAKGKKLSLILDTDWVEFGGNKPHQEKEEVLTQSGKAKIELAPFSAKYYVLQDCDGSEAIETHETETIVPETGQETAIEAVQQTESQVNQQMTQNIKAEPISGPWYDRAVVYHIYTLGFCGAPEYNEGEKTKGSRILKVLDQIPHLKEMGMNTVYFGPIFESLWHGYDTSDYYQTDTRLGSIEEFQQVFKELKKNGIRIVLDGVFNHVGRGFAPFRDVLEKRENSAYRDWFCNMNFGGRSAAGDPFSYETWQGNWELVKLNLKNPAVVEHLLGAVKMWVEVFDIDGLRLDAADCIDKEFFRRLKTFTGGLKKDFWLMGEIIHGDYKMWANPEMMHSVTNYECWKGIYSSHNDKNYFEIAHSLRRQFAKGGIYENLRLYNFLDNHDVNRIASLLKCKADLSNAYTLMFLMPGVPSVYYGSEWGIEGVKTKGKEADKPVRPSIDEVETHIADQKLPESIKKLADLRQVSNAVVYGSYEDVLIRNQQFVFARNYKEECVIAAFNIAEEKESFSFEYRGKKYEFTLEPHSNVIFA